MWSSIGSIVFPSSIEFLSSSEESEESEESGESSFSESVEDMDSKGGELHLESVDSGC